MKHPVHPPTRRSLVEKLADRDDHRRWQEFFQTYRGLIFHAARRAGLRDAEAEEVVQETLITVSKNIGEFRYDPATGSFKGWLLNITRWRIADQFRKRSTEAPALAADDTSRTSAMNRLPGPDEGGFATVWDQEWRTQLLQAAVQALKQKIEPRQWQIFDCYVLKEWPARKVATDLQTSLAQVYLAKTRVGAALKAEIRRIEAGKF